MRFPIVRSPRMRDWRSGTLPRCQRRGPRRKEEGPSSSAAAELRSDQHGHRPEQFVSGALAAAAALLLAGFRIHRGHAARRAEPLAPVRGRELAVAARLRVGRRRQPRGTSSNSPPTSALTHPSSARARTGSSSEHPRDSLKKTVPNGTGHWRVRAVSADGSVSPWSAPRQLRKGWTLAPALQAPAHGAFVSHPTNPLVLRWSAVPHASKYPADDCERPALGFAVGGQQNVDVRDLYRAAAVTSFLRRARLLVRRLDEHESPASSSP